MGNKQNTWILSEGEGTPTKLLLPCQPQTSPPPTPQAPPTPQLQPPPILQPLLKLTTKTMLDKSNKSHTCIFI